MSTLSPTRREICLTVALLALLVLLPKQSFNPYHASSALTWNQQQQPSISRPQTELVPTDGEFDENEYSCSLANPSEDIPETKIIAHVPGWTIFDRLYYFKGTVYIVTDTPEDVPDRSLMSSTSLKIQNGPEAIAARLPTDKEMRIISTQEAKELFGLGGQCVDGVTWLVNDPSQFITHYYHWSAELFFGLWRTYSSLDPYIHSSGDTSLPPPRRMVFTALDAHHWRDYAYMNQFVLRSALPSISMEFATDWQERAAMGRPFVFDRVVFADRSAAMYGYNYRRTQRTASEPFALPGSPHWWSTMRRNVLMAAGIPQGIVETGNGQKAVITYISRQEWGRRMLIPEHHERLVEELYKLRDTYGYEVNVVSMDKLSRIEQLQLAARTTIMMGVHGNGLTSLVWMKPTPRSTVMEFFFPGGFAHDYEWTTRSLGMVHYGFWGDSAFTRPEVPKVAYPEGFQGTSIPIDGELVARLCHERLTLAEETDD